MTTQLRLVEPPEPTPGPARTARPARRAPARRGRVAGARRGRRAVSWGEWHLDAGTRRVGREGVAQARRALEAVLEQTAFEQERRKAS